MTLEIDGIRLVRASGPHIELYFDWQKLPPLDLRQEYYIVRFTPQSSVAPVEYARPNSAGPLYFSLKENIQYELNVLRTPYLKYEVASSLKSEPVIEMIAEHENRHALIWSNIDFRQHNVARLIVTVDGVYYKKIPVDADPKLEIGNRPKSIKIQIENGPVLFQVTTNLRQFESVSKFQFKLNHQDDDFYLSTIVKPNPQWTLRAETTPYFLNHLNWWQKYLKHYPGVDASRITGSYRFYEDQGEPTDIRVFGFGCSMNRSAIQQIQQLEWKIKDLLPVIEYKVQLQITSAHRELLKKTLIEKTIAATLDEDVIGFSFEEVAKARQTLFEIDPLVSWENAFLELVLWFKCEGHEWQEFQREIAYCHRWEYTPQDQTEGCRADWILWNQQNPDNLITLTQPARVLKDRWPAKVVLKPFHDKRLLAWWDLDRNGVESFIRKEWHVVFDEVRFYLKICEEYLGNRIHRPDLDCHLLELFSSHQTVYFDIDSNKCYTAEIVARHDDLELALTPISNQQVAPRSIAKTPSHAQDQQKYTNHWYHTSQREVRHAHGHDSNNIGKVLFHFHMHSPNLFRADPFRESFLKAKTWPIRTPEGVEVHNVPGEWVMKNCLDSWLPLLRVFRTLIKENVDFQASLNISPPVAYTLTSSRFKDYMSRYLLRVRAHIETQIKLMKATHHNQEFIWAAERYLEDVNALDEYYNNEISKNMIGAFRDLELRGFLEIQTCTATHGMPGLLASTPDSLDSQISLATRSHHRIFGDRPRGIWLAENSFFPGIDQFLNKEGLRYFFVEAEAILKGSVCPQEEEYNPVVIPGSDIVVFGRSRLGRTQVWDAEIGYAGHPDFREYHFRHMGLPLKRITSKLSDEKLPYNPDIAEKTAQKLACDFHHKLSEKAHELSSRAFKSMPVITCTYDAELFGHHWAEGPMFIEELFREFHRKGDKIGLTTASHYLVQEPNLPVSNPNPSTWGHETSHMRWTDPKVSWTFRELERADNLLRRYLGLAMKKQFNSFQVEAVEQMGAELVRAQSSDLTFVIVSGDFEEDMRREIQKYLDYFYRLKCLVDNNLEDWEFLRFRKYENDMFPEISDYYQIR